MSNRFFCDDLLQDELVELDAAESHHLRHVMRAAVGDDVVLFDGRGTEAAARVERIDKRRVVLRVASRRAVSREAPRELILGVAAPRGGRERFLIEKGVELGVRRLVWLQTERSVSRPGAKAVEKHRRAVIEASKQCGRNELMEVATMSAEEFWGLARLPAVRWIADPHAPLPVPLSQLDPSAPVAVAIGPEGGFTPEERARAAEAGWRAVSLGPRTLRIETAAIALAARLLLP